MSREAILLGAGGFARETLDVIEAHNQSSPLNQILILGVADDNPSASNVGRIRRRGYAHLGTIAETALTHPCGAYILGIGNPQVKKAISHSQELLDWDTISVIHPAANIGSQSEIGLGSIICGGVQLSTNVHLGRHVHLNPGAIIGHDVQLDDFVSVNPGAVVSGEVIVKEGSLVGAGAVVLQGLTVGPQAVVGAAACVTRVVRARSTVAGIPARELDKEQPNQ